MAFDIAAPATAPTTAPATPAAMAFPVPLPRLPEDFPFVEPVDPCADPEDSPSPDLPDDGPLPFTMPPLPPVRPVKAASVWTGTHNSRHTKVPKPTAPDCSRSERSVPETVSTGLPGVSKRNSPLPRFKAGDDGPATERVACFAAGVGRKAPKNRERILDTRIQNSSARCSNSTFIDPPKSNKTLWANWLASRNTIVILFLGGGPSADTPLTVSEAAPPVALTTRPPNPPINVPANLAAPAPMAAPVLAILAWLSIFGGNSPTIGFKTSRIRSTGKPRSLSDVSPTKYRPVFAKMNRPSVLRCNSGCPP